jgi:hypothetical protein
VVTGQTNVGLQIGARRNSVHRVCDGLRSQASHPLIHPEGTIIMLNNLKSGVAIATAAAALFSMGATVSTSAQAADEATVKCVGVNSCKGTSDCKTAKSECKGQNSCKGMGWNGKKSEADCKAAGGTVAK